MSSMRASEKPFAKNMSVAAARMARLVCAVFSGLGERRRGAVPAFFTMTFNFIQNDADYTRT